MKSTYVYIALVLVLAAGLIFVKSKTETTRIEAVTPFDTFAQCLSDAGAKFYGAYWCPHCQAQKKLLQNSTKIPYVECSTPNGQAQTQICIDEKIDGYPTWKFADGSLGEGEQTLQELSEKTNCALPTL